MDSGYDPRRGAAAAAISWLREQGLESGVHPGYFTFGQPEALKAEVAVLREILGEGPLGGRQHYLRWNPDTWHDWERCGLAYDSSVGYADRVGFRAGTCVPYRPWLFRFNRESELLEIPLIAMDVTLINIMKLGPREVKKTILDLIGCCEIVGGVFTLLWHNSSLLDYPEYSTVYEAALRALECFDTFELQNHSF